MFWFTWEVHIGKEIGTQSPGSVGRVGVSAGGLGTFGGKLHGPSGPILCGLLWPILHRLCVANITPAVRANILRAVKANITPAIGANITQAVVAKIICCWAAPGSFRL